MNISKFDESCLDLTINLAKKSLDSGNFPVGAVLSINETIIAKGNNSGETSGNYSNHAETAMIIENGKKILECSKADQIITLYSSLEPCLMCLGVAVMNKINRIIYIQPDSLAGACHLDIKSLGSRYQKVWPEIVETNYSKEPINLIKIFLNRQIDMGVRVDWSINFLKLLE